MAEQKKRITKPVLIFASKHSSQLIKTAIFQAFSGLIGRYVFIFHRKYPEIDIEDLEQIARERALICIQKWTPKGDSFSFPKYLKQALFFGLRRYCHKELKHLKCAPMKRDEPFLTFENKNHLRLNNWPDNRLKDFSNKKNEKENVPIIEKLEMNSQSIGYKVSRFMKKLLED